MERQVSSRYYRIARSQVDSGAEHKSTEVVSHHLQPHCLQKGFLFPLQNYPETTTEMECGDFYNRDNRATMDAMGYILFLGRGDASG
jgi:hypothetical protein